MPERFAVIFAQGYFGDVTPVISAHPTLEDARQEVDGDRALMIIESTDGFNVGDEVHKIDIGRIYQEHTRGPGEFSTKSEPDRTLKIPDDVPRMVVPTDKYAMRLYFEEEAARWGIGIANARIGPVQHVLVFENVAAIRALHEITGQILWSSAPEGLRLIRGGRSE
jgi:hypothetical protein